MSRTFVTVEAEVEVSQVIDDADSNVLIEELKSREEWPEHEIGSEDDILLTDVYYALRDGDIERSIQLINPLLDRIIGRQV